ncbi:MAG: hypothetical protein U0228_10530 [Myxococcaceae bacterium]
MKPTLLAQLELSAASGLVHHDGALYVVADDALEVLETSVGGATRGRYPLTDAPLGAPVHKADKADLEALVLIGDQLIALGSGSSPKRRKALRLRVHGAGNVRLPAIDLGPLYAALGRHFSELNIEGAVVRGDEVILAQRGNGARRENALVFLDRARFEAGLETAVITESCLKRIQPVSLGALRGVDLTLTDLAVGPSNTLLFTAAAEDTTNPYDDGEVTGSVVGRVSSDGAIETSSLVELASVKWEGVCWLPSQELRLVADPDDPRARAPLFGMPWP